MLKKSKKDFSTVHREIDSKKVVVDEKSERKEPVRDIGCTPDRRSADSVYKLVRGWRPTLYIREF